jgi:hypothetical protein
MDLDIEALLLQPSCSQVAAATLVEALEGQSSVLTKERAVPPPSICDKGACGIPLQGVVAVGNHADFGARWLERRSRSQTSSLHKPGHDGK